MKAITIISENCLYRDSWHFSGFELRIPQETGALFQSVSLFWERTRFTIYYNHSRISYAHQNNKSCLPFAVPLLVSRHLALHCIVLYCTVLSACLSPFPCLFLGILSCTVLYCTVLYCTVLYCTALYCTVLYFAVLYCIALHCTALYCTVLYCSVLCCRVRVAMGPQFGDTDFLETYTIVDTADYLRQINQQLIWTTCAPS